MVKADLRVASAHATQALLRYGDLGTAEQERSRLMQEEQNLSAKAAKLLISSPMAGIVGTPHLPDLAGTDLDQGMAVIEVLDDSTLLARVFIPEFAMHDVRVGSPVRLKVQSRLLPISGILQSLSPDWMPLDPALGQKEQLTGINPPRFYAAEVPLVPAADLRPGMTGAAKIRVGRRSMAGLIFRFGRNLVTRRIW